MRDVGFWAVLVGIFGACIITSRLVAPLLQIDTKLVLLAFLILAYIALSSFVWLRRRRLQKGVEKLSELDQEVAAALDPELRYAIPKKQRLSGSVATWVGCVAINGPIIPIMVGPLSVVHYILEIESGVISGLAFVLGFILAWSWWSVGVTVWRRWAVMRGLDEGEIQWRGENATILWPTGHFLEKTELGKTLERWRKRKR